MRLLTYTQLVSKQIFTRDAQLGRYQKSKNSPGTRSASSSFANFMTSDHKDDANWGFASIDIVIGAQKKSATTILLGCEGHRQAFVAETSSDTVLEIVSVKMTTGAQETQSRRARKKGGKKNKNLLTFPSKTGPLAASRAWARIRSGLRGLCSQLIGPIAQRAPLTSKTLHWSQHTWARHGPVHGQYAQYNQYTTELGTSIDLFSLTYC